MCTNLVAVSSDLNSNQVATITVLLEAGKTIKEISKFADLDRVAVTSVARDLDIDPPTAAQKRAKELFASADGSTYQEVAAQLRAEKLTNDDGKAVHYLSVSTWVANFGWRWGGSEDGEYSPTRVGSSPARSKYTLRLSQKLAAQMNSPSAVEAAANAAWEELDSDRTRVVMLAIIRGAASADVTDVAAVKKALFATHGEAIRSARA